MGTEIWIISLPLSDSILCLKIIHPPNFREEPNKTTSKWEAVLLCRSVELERKLFQSPVACLKI